MSCVFGYRKQLVFGVTCWLYNSYQDKAESFLQRDISRALRWITRGKNSTLELWAVYSIRTDTIQRESNKEVLLYFRQSAEGLLLVSFRLKREMGVACNSIRNQFKPSSSLVDTTGISNKHQCGCWMDILCWVTEAEKSESKRHLRDDTVLLQWEC